MATDQDMMRKNEYDVSVDDILAEYELRQQAGRDNAITRQPGVQSSEFDSNSQLDDDGVKVYNPKDRSGFKTDEVREYIPGNSSNYAAVNEDDSADNAQYSEEYYDNTQYADRNDEYYDDAQYTEGDEYYDDAQYADGEEYYDDDQYAEGEEYCDDDQYAEGEEYYGDEQYADDDEYYDDAQYTEDEDYYNDTQYPPGEEYYDNTRYADEGEEYYDELLPSGEEEPAAEEFDPRFNLGGKKKKTMVYGGRELDLSPDENYVPPVQPNYIPVPETPPMEYASETDEEETAEPEEEKPRKKRFVKKLWKKDRAAEEEKELENSEPDFNDEGREYIVSADFKDFTDSIGSYAPVNDYSAPKEPLSYDDDFPSFKEYLLGLVTGVIYKLRNPGAAVADGGTIEDSDEDLGPEAAPMSASKYYGSFIHSLKLRFRISLILLAILTYISLGFPLPGMLKTLKVQAAMCIALQLGIMVTSLDVVTNAILKIFRGHFGADSMATVLCLLTSIDAVAVSSGGFGTAHTPLCVLSSLSLLGILGSSLLSAKGLRKSLRVPAIGKMSYTISGESGLKGDGLTLLKSRMPSKGFVRRSEEEAPDENIFQKICPILLIFGLLLTLIVCAAKKSWAEFIFIFTAILSPAVPVSALLCFALPYFVGSARIFSSGAAIAGWSGLCEVGSSKNLVVTDRDLFPQGSVKIEDIRIFSNASAEKIISYAGTMIGASGAGIASCFGELMEKNHCAPKHVENFEFLPGGGMKGIIDGETVLCGGTELMRLMNVQLPFRLIEKCSVLLAVDGILYGIFNMKYTADDKVRKALVGLMRSNRHPIFAVRDFNISPEMLHESFDLATDGYDFPPYVERFKLSEAKPGERSRVAAVVCREGLGPLIHMADTGRSMFVATRLNILITVVSAVLGIMTVFIRFLSLGYVGVGFILLYMLLWFLPVAVLSFFLKF